MADYAHAAGMVTYSQAGAIPLFYSDIDRFTGKGTITAGASGLTAFVRGTVLGRVTANGKWTLALSASADGSQTPRAVLANDTDLSGGDLEAIIYKGGEFNTQALVLGTGIVLNTATLDAMQLLGFSFKTGINP